MSDAQVFELTFAYDQASLRAAAAVLFWRHWKSKLRTTLVSVFISILGTGGMFVYLRFFSWLWWLGLYLILWPVLWAYVWWATKRRVLSCLANRARCSLRSLTSRLCRTVTRIRSFGNDSKSFQLDAENLYLFLGPSLAYILPIRQIGEAAIDFAKGPR